MSGRHNASAPTSPVEEHDTTYSNPSNWSNAPAGLPAASPPLPRKPVAPYERRPGAASAYPVAPIPPPHRSSPPSPPRERRAYPDQYHYGAAGAGGAGLTGVAVGTAGQYPRESETQVLRDIDNLYGGRMMSPPPNRLSQPQASEGRVAPLPPVALTPPRSIHNPEHSQSSLTPLMAYGADMSAHTSSPGMMSTRSMGMVGSDAFAYDQRSSRGTSQFHGDGYDNYFDPRDIADDGEDGFEGMQPQRYRRFGGGATAGAAATPAAGAGMLKAFGSRDTGGNYDAVPGNRSVGSDPEKSEWLQGQTSGGKRLKWLVGAGIILVIVGAVIGGILGGVVFNKSGNGSGGSSSSGTGSSTSGSHGLFDINSSQVQDLLNDDDLHRVFPGVDYTPLNAQYPQCLSNPPDQNNITLDVAMLSQLTPAIRLYGTDCQQTEMVLTAIDRLEMNSTLKVWLGVWLGTNQTTNTRQMTQMYRILDTYPSSHFAGIIVGNEVLFRKDLTITQLSDQLTSVRSNLSARSIDLPVATSDLGDNWTAGLAAASDIIMSNVHPFFAGVTPDVAPGWTWDFWQTNDVSLTPAPSSAGASYPHNIISETGWPSQGGNDCGTQAKCPTPTQGAIAGIDELNSFMEGWVCPSIANGTTYFWFEAFDEPWKATFDDPTMGDFWEPHWGLMDANRKLKDGVRIPDCGGKTLTTPY